jgi:hypothetical protein
MWADYQQDLDARLEELHTEVHKDTYRARPSLRVYIPKVDGRKRPLGIAALEDKIVQLCAGYLRPQSCIRIQINAFAPNIPERSLVREFRSQGSVRGAVRKGSPYRELIPKKGELAAKFLFASPVARPPVAAEISSTPPVKGTATGSVAGNSPADTLSTR